MCVILWWRVTDNFAATVHYAFSVILQPSEKDRKIYWTVRPPNHKICSFAGGSQFYQRGLKSPKALSIYLKKILPFHEKNWRCTWREYCVLNKTSNVIWESPVPASDQCRLEIPSETWELRTLLLCLVARCRCLNGAVQRCQAHPGSAWHSAWAPPAQLGTRSLLPCQAPTAHGSALTTNTFSLFRKDVLVYQTVLGMQINWCNCRINRVNSCKIKAWLFSEILPGSQVHWATITLSPLKILKVERHFFCHYYSLMKFGHSSVHRKCTLIIQSVLLHS